MVISRKLSKALKLKFIQVGDSLSVAKERRSGIPTSIPILEVEEVAKT